LISHGFLAIGKGVGEIILSALLLVSLPV